MGWSSFFGNITKVSIFTIYFNTSKMPTGQFAIIVNVTQFIGWQLIKWVSLTITANCMIYRGMHKQSFDCLSIGYWLPFNCFEFLLIPGPGFCPCAFIQKFTQPKDPSCTSVWSPHMSDIKDRTCLTRWEMLDRNLYRWFPSWRPHWSPTGFFYCFRNRF